MKMRPYLTVVAWIGLMLVALAVHAQEEQREAEQPAPPPVESWKPAGQITPPAPTAGAEQTSGETGPMFQLGDFNLRAHGRIQVLAGLVGDDAHIGSGDLMNRDGFRMLRGRLGMEGQLTRGWEFAFEYDLFGPGDEGGEIEDASIRYKPFEWIWLRVGYHKLDFSHARIISSGSMQFIERPIWVPIERATGSHMLDLDSQVGATLGGQWGMFFYRLGAYNGVPGHLSGDINNGLLYLLRIGAGQGELGTGEADLSRGGFRWRLALNGYLNMDAAADYRGAGADLSVKWAGASFHAEALWAKGIPAEASQAVTVELDDIERWGMSAQAGYLLPISIIDLELAVRFAMMDDQVHIDNEGDAWELAAGVNLYLDGERLKLMLNYFRKEEMHGAALDNDLLAAMLQLKF